MYKIVNFTEKNSQCRAKNLTTELVGSFKNKPVHPLIVNEALLPFNLFFIICVKSIFHGGHELLFSNFPTHHNDVTFQTYTNASFLLFD
jgi:hypothetical protein